MLFMNKKYKPMITKQAVNNEKEQDYSPNIIQVKGLKKWKIWKLRNWLKKGNCLPIVRYHLINIKFKKNIILNSKSNNWV